MFKVLLFQIYSICIHIQLLIMMQIGENAETKQLNGNSFHEQSYVLISNEELTLSNWETCVTCVFKSSKLKNDFQNTL